MVDLAAILVALPWTEAFLSSEAIKVSRPFVIAIGTASRAP
jgi:hypothetical protein